MRIRGWLGRTDQSTKVKGMFVRPEQVLEIKRRHVEIQRLRLLVSRVDELDRMVLEVETAAQSEAYCATLEATLRSITKLSGKVIFADRGSIPEDGKFIYDLR